MNGEGLHVVGRLLDTPGQHKEPPSPLVRRDAEPSRQEGGSSGAA